MAVPPPPRISTTAGQRLADIVEDRPLAGAELGGLTNASHARRFFGSPPRASEDKRPPSYSTEMDEIPRQRRLSDPFADPPVKRRHRSGLVPAGWICGTLIAIAAILALAVGLGIGLSRGKHSTGAAAVAPSGSQPSSSAKLPIGSWSFRTYLQNVTTQCTSISSTWSCQPGATYDVSPATSEAEFDWNIFADPSNASAYLISANANPFSISNFANRSLRVDAQGTPDESYTFNLDMNKQVWVQGRLTDAIQNRTTCFFNQTILSATLYPHRNRTYPVQSRSQTGSISIWPGSITVKQMAVGGQDVPECFVSEDNMPVGDPLNILVPRPANDMCSCIYQS